MSLNERKNCIAELFPASSFSDFTERKERISEICMLFIFKVAHFSLNSLEIFNDLRLDKFGNIGN